MLQASSIAKKLNSHTERACPLLARSAKRSCCSIAFKQLSCVQPTCVQIEAAAGQKDSGVLIELMRLADTIVLIEEGDVAGPFTVFAPTNAAFDKLPAGTVEGLLKPDQKDALSNILEYHVYVGVIKTDAMRDGQVLGQVNGKNITLNVKDGKYMINGKATILASVPASNGIIHVIDEVLLPPQ